MDSLSDLESQRKKVVNEITTTIDEIDEINNKIETLNSDISTDKNRIKNINLELAKNSVENSRMNVLEKELHTTIVLKLKSSTTFE